MPLEIPDTIPAEPTVAIPVDVDDHVPPPVAELSVVLAPTHTVPAPEIAAGEARIVIVAVSKQPLPVT